MEDTGEREMEERGVLRHGADNKKHKKIANNNLLQLFVCRL